MNEKELEAFLQREQEVGDLRAVMGTVEGRRFIWRLLGGFGAAPGIFHSSFVQGGGEVTAFNEGARNVLLAVFAECMSHVPGSYLIMQKEAIDEAQRRSNEETRGYGRRAKAGGDTGGGDSDD